MARLDKMRAAVLGAGQCFYKMLPGLRAHFDLGAVYDPNPNAVGLSALHQGEQEVLVGSEEELFTRLTGLDAVFILTPPIEHVRQIVRASSFGKPIFVEKPFAIDEEGIQTVMRALTDNPRVYFSDFYVDVRAAALLKVFGRHDDQLAWMEPFLSPQEAFLSLDSRHKELGDIRFLKGTLLEQTLENDPHARPWLREEQQGGVLLDLAIHYVALFFALFDEPLTIEDCLVSCEGPDDRKTSHVMPAAETYAFLRLHSSSAINFEIETSNCWREDRRQLYLAGARGEILMDFGRLEGKKNMLFVTLNGKRLSVELQPNYWALVPLGFYKYLQSGKEEPHGLAWARPALELIIAAKKYSRGFKRDARATLKR